MLSIGFDIRVAASARKSTPAPDGEGSGEIENLSMDEFFWSFFVFFLGFMALFFCLRGVCFFGFEAFEFTFICFDTTANAMGEERGLGVLTTLLAVLVLPAGETMGLGVPAILPCDRAAPPSLSMAYAAV
jgi:hypothetical protein